MDPLSLSASIAGLVGLAGGLMQLTQTLRNSLKEDALQIVSTVSLEIDLFVGVLSYIESWTQSNGSQLLNLTPFIENCTSVIRQMGGQLLALESVATRSGIKKLTSGFILAGKIEQLEGSRRDLEAAKSSLLLALSTKEKDAISESLDIIQDKLESLSIAISKARIDETEPKKSPDIQTFDDWLDSFAPLDAKRESPKYNRKAVRRSDVQDGESSNIYLRLANLKNKAGDAFSETLTVSPDTKVFDILSRLHDMGYENVCGFETTDRKHFYGPFSPRSKPLSVLVTKGRSNYDSKFGLRINENERLVDFYEAYHEYSRDKSRTVQTLDITQMNKCDDKLILEGWEQGSTAIRFHRAARLPGDGRIYNKPKYYDTFPLLKVSDYQHKLPPAIAEKGGYFFPMFQREAIGIGFHASYHKEEKFAIKVYAGSVNVISGSTSSVKPDKQDFVTVPKQGRLDGINIGKNIAQQFVAMPLTWNYSIEKEATGSEYIGGFQFEVVEKHRTDVQFYDDQNYNYIYDGIKQTGCSAQSLCLFKSPQELRVQRLAMDVSTSSSTRFRKEEADQEYIERLMQEEIKRWGKSTSAGFEHYRVRFAHELGEHNYRAVRSSSKNPLILHAVKSLRFTMLDWVRPSNRDHSALSMEFSPSCCFKDFVQTLYDEFLLPGNFHPEALHINGCSVTELINKVPDRYTILSEIAPSGGSISVLNKFIDSTSTNKVNILLCCWRCRHDRQKCIQNPYYPDACKRCHMLRYTCTLMEPPVEQREGRTLAFKGRKDGWQMGIGAEGRLIQKIEKSTNPDIWNWKKPIFVNIQIVNSIIFQSITGLTPGSPIPLKLSHEFQIADSGFVQRASANFPIRGFRSVTEADGESDIDIDLRTTLNRNNTGCACCELYFCDTILQPCGHAFCSKCIHSLMTYDERIVCDACDEDVVGTLVFAAPMHLPSHDLLGFPDQENITSGSEISEKQEQEEERIYEFTGLSTKDHPKNTTVEAFSKALTVAELEAILEAVMPLPRDLQLKRDLEDHKAFAFHVYCISGHPHQFNLISHQLRRLSLAEKVILLDNILLHGPRWDRYLPARIELSRIEPLLSLIPSVDALILAKGKNYVREIIGRVDLTGKKSSIEVWFLKLFPWIINGSYSLHDLGISLRDLVDYCYTEDRTKMVFDYIVFQPHMILPAAINACILPIVHLYHGYAILPRLIRLGGDIHTRDEKGNTLLHLEARSGYSRKNISTILELGANLALLNNSLESPLHLAIRGDMKLTTIELLDHISSEARGILNLRDCEGFTPWHLGLLFMGFIPEPRHPNLSEEVKNIRNGLLELGADPKLEFPATQTKRKSDLLKKLRRSRLNLEEVRTLIDQKLFEDYQINIERFPLVELVDSESE